MPRLPERECRYLFGRRIATWSIVVVLGIALGSCGNGRDSKKLAPELCTSANAYFWYGREVAGQGGSVPTGGRAERDVNGLRSALDEMRQTAPAELKDEVEFARRFWADIDQLLSRYDYGEGPKHLPESEYTRLMSKYEPDQAKGLRLTSFLKDRCGKTSTPFPSNPTRKSG